MCPFKQSYLLEAGFLYKVFGFISLKLFGLGKGTISLALNLLE
jgi:hypothetical protein